jgi:DNA-damage-inducible protein J
MKMAKTANINVRVEPNLKARVETIFSCYGMTVAQAVDIFLHKALLENGLPFDLREPHYNAETLAAFAEVERMKQNPSAYKGYSDVDAMMEELLA